LKILKVGEIDVEEYDQWRYTYPKMEIKRSKAERDNLRDKCKAESDKKKDK
jgi:hypothetical protein